jgi:hypothetical protein
VKKTGNYDEALLNQFLYNRRAHPEGAIKHLRAAVDAKTFNEKLDFLVKNQIKRPSAPSPSPTPSPSSAIHVKERDLPPELEPRGSSVRKEPKSDVGGEERPPERAEAGTFAHKYKEQLRKLLTDKEEWRKTMKGDGKGNS